MPRKSTNPRVGGDVIDYIRRRKAADPDFASNHQEEFDRLQLARHLKHLRESRKLSQGDLAQRVGTKQPAIARLESGRVVPRLDLLHKIAFALELRLDVRFVAAPRARAAGRR